MSAFADALLLLVVVASLTLGIIAIVNASAALRRVRELEGKLDALREEAAIARLVATSRATEVAAALAALAAAERPVEVGRRARLDPDLHEASPSGVVALTPIEPLRSIEEVEQRSGAAEDSQPAGSREPTARAPGARLGPANTTSDRVERALGLVWATRIGAAMLLLGVLFFFKVAVERNWLGPWARVGLGVAAGLVCVGLAARLRTRLNERWVGAMVGLGLAILLASAWAAHALYHLVPGWVAFLALSAFAVGTGMLAVRWRLEAVLVSATAAGFVNLAALSGSFPGHALYLLFAAVLGGAALFTAVARGWLLAALAVPLGLVPGLVSRHFGAPDWLDAAFGPALPVPGGVDTVVALLIAVLLAAAFVAAARRLVAHTLVADTLLWTAVILPLSLAAMLVPERLPLGTFVAVFALAVALERWFFEAARGERATLPLDALHLATHALGGLVVLGSTLAGPGAPSDLELVPALVFVLVGLASAATAPSRPAFVALELAILSGFAFLWACGHGSWSAPQPASLALPLVTAAGLGFVLARDRRRPRAPEDGASPIALCAAIAVVALLVVAVFRMRLPEPWTTMVLVGFALALMAITRRTSNWVAWLATSALALALMSFLAQDVAVPNAQRMDFLASEGARGAYFPLPFIGPRALPLLAIALAALAFRSLARREHAPPWLQSLHTTVRIAGFALAFGYALDQATLVVSLVATAGVDMADADLSGSRLAGARAATVVALTAVMALFGAAVLAWGFAVRSRLDRWVGLGVVGLALLKLVTYDLSVMDSVARTIVLVCFGALLLASGFLYARFAPGVKSLLGADRSDTAPD